MSASYGCGLLLQHIHNTSTISVCIRLACVLVPMKLSIHVHIHNVGNIHSSNDFLSRNDVVKCIYHQRNVPSLFFILAASVCSFFKWDRSSLWVHSLSCFFNSLVLSSPVKLALFELHVVFIAYSTTLWNSVYIDWLVHAPVHSQTHEDAYSHFIHLYVDVYVLLLTPLYQ